MTSKSYKDEVIKYANDVVSGKIKRGGNIRECKRFLDWLERDDIELKTVSPDLVINIIHKLFVHKQGEDLNGEPLMNKPFILADWQKFIVYNLVGWFHKGTNLRVIKEAFIFIPRKNGKTLFVSALTFALGILERKSGSQIYITSASLNQSLESFKNILYTVNYRKIDKDEEHCIIHNNSFAHDLELKFTDENGLPNGFFRIVALASNPDTQDSFNCNIAIADEIHAFKKASSYNRFKEAMKSYSNKLMIGITTAGDNINSFCYNRLQYAEKILDGLCEDDTMFCFVSHADKTENGDVDFQNEEQHEKANPNYGITIRKEDMKADAYQALFDPKQRKDFLSRSLNIYTNASKAWFDIEKFRLSDSNYNWSLQELAKLPIKWYGGADLSRVYDLTASALFGHYEKENVDIVITHAFFPVEQINNKLEKDNIPVYEWSDEGWLTICNGSTVNHGDVVNWFIHMRQLGFKIQEIGQDKKFAKEFFVDMQQANFRVVDQPQYAYVKSSGFRYIEKSVLDKTFYYLHSGAYEYCVSNVKGIEKIDDVVSYDKIAINQRIDLFDASVFSACRYLDNLERNSKAKKWFEE